MSHFFSLLHIINLPSFFRFLTSLDLSGNSVSTVGVLAIVQAIEKLCDIQVSTN